ncbi:MAG: acyl-CoA dehydrogenase family protein, partial [Bacteroidota bacterium]
NVKVPVANRLHKEGKGLNVALTCLNYGRCTLSSGILGAAKKARDQATKWARTRYQFNRPLSDFDLVQEKIARMAAYTYAIDAMLYMMTGMLDRHDSDIMVETAAAKVFASEMGWQVIDDAMQIMGGEGYMTENELERAFRDARIYRIVEGANEVMWSFVFAYGGKQLAEQMLGVQTAMFYDTDENPFENIGRMVTNALNPAIMSRAIPLGLQLVLRIKPKKPVISGYHPDLRPFADRLAKLVRDHSHWFKLASMKNKEHIVTRQTIQARISDTAIHLFAMSAVLSKLSAQLRAGVRGTEFLRDQAAALHFFEMAELTINENIRALNKNADRSMREAAKAAIDHTDTLSDGKFYISERSPVSAGNGRATEQQHIKQFPGGSQLEMGDGRSTDAEVEVKPRA